MSSAALGLALGAAVLHAIWNLLLAASRDVLAATAVALCAGLVVAAPFAVVTWGVEREAVPWLVASAALELVYFFTLTAAYARAELSLVYPLARGGAPVLVLLGALATGVVPSGSEALGVTRRRRRSHPRARPARRRPARRPARARDRRPDRRLHARRRGGDRAREPGPVPPLRAHTGGARRRVRLRAGAAASGAPAATVLAGCGGFLAYVLVLAALRLAPAAPVAAVRETSVLFAVALAAPLLGERVTRGGSPVPRSSSPAWSRWATA